MQGPDPKEKQKQPQVKNVRISPNVWAFVIILITTVLAYRIVATPCSLQFDFPAFLSLLLAIFSVALAALFYFKATETSNAFYDNTYKFTRDIAQLLVKIESGFGEKLRHLDEAYRGMQDRFDQLPGRIQAKEAKKELKEEEKELQKIVQEKESLIESLVTKAQLQGEEREQFLEKLHSQDEALQEAKQEIRFLQRRVSRARSEPGRINEGTLNSDMLNLLRSLVVDTIEPEYILSRPFRLVAKRFEKMIPALPSVLVRQMQAHELLDLDNDLTTQGMRLLKQLAESRV